MEAAVRVQQNNDDAVRYGTAAARLLEKVVLVGWWLVAVAVQGSCGVWWWQVGVMRYLVAVAGQGQCGVWWL